MYPKKKRVATNGALLYPSCPHGVWGATHARVEIKSLQLLELWVTFPFSIVGKAWLCHPGKGLEQGLEETCVWLLNLFSIMARF
jgi:hypothetical protein